MQTLAFDWLAHVKVIVNMSVSRVKNQTLFSLAIILKLNLNTYTHPVCFVFIKEKVKLLDLLKINDTEPINDCCIPGGDIWWR